MGLHKIFWLIFSKSSIFFQYIIRIIFLKILKLKIKNINKTNSKIIFIYDLNKCPLALGEIFDCLMLARSFQCLNKKIFFYFTKDDLRDDYLVNFKSKKMLNNRFLEIKLLSYSLIGKKNISFRKKLYEKIINENKLQQDIIFNTDFFGVGIPIYKVAHNLCFKTYGLMSLAQQKNFLLNKDSIKKKKLINFKENSYLTLGLRASLNNEIDRNVTESELINFIKKIKKNNSKKILIISDNKSYLKFKEKYFFKKNNIYFSKKWKTTFVEDGSLILNSKKYFQLKGSGIQMFAEFSKKNYLIFHDFRDYTICAKILRSDLYFDLKKKKKNIWSLKNQVFKSINSFS
jgi:hypothetical protein